MLRMPKHPRSISLLSRRATFYLEEMKSPKRTPTGKWMVRFYIQRQIGLSPRAFLIGQNLKIRGFSAGSTSWSISMRCHTMVHFDAVGSAHDTSATVPSGATPMHIAGLQFMPPLLANSIAPFAESNLNVVTSHFATVIEFPALHSRPLLLPSKFTLRHIPASETL